MKSVERNILLLVQPSSQPTLDHNLKMASMYFLCIFSVKTDKIQHVGTGKYTDWTAIRMAILLGITVLQLLIFAEAAYKFSVRVF